MAVSSSIVQRRLGAFTIVVDRELCIGNQSCINVAPDVFELDDKEIVTVRPEAPAIDRARLAEACDACPVRALKLLDAQGKPIAG